MGADGWGRGRWKGEGACKYGCSGGGGSPAWLDPDPAARYSPAWHTLDPDPEARYSPPQRTAISAMLSMYRCLISREAAAAASVAVAEPVASAWEIRCCWLRGEVGTTEGEG